MNVNTHDPLKKTLGLLGPSFTCAVITGLFVYVMVTPDLMALIISILAGWVFTMVIILSWFLGIRAKTSGLKNVAYGLFGIPMIKLPEDRMGESDRIYRAGLETLEADREIKEIDLHHLQSRLEILNAVIKAGPYAIMSSFVAAGWAVLSGESTALNSLLLLAAFIVMLVVGCNRKAKEAETTLGTLKLNKNKTEERYRVREEEVKADAQKAKDAASDVFDHYFRVTFSREFFDQQRKTAHSMLPESTSLRSTNLAFRHKECFRLATELKKKTIEFIDCAEAWRSLVGSMVKSIQPGAPHLDPGDQERRVDEFSRSLIFCISENIVKPTQIGPVLDRKKIDGSFIKGITTVLEPPIRSLLEDPGLKAKARELEGLMTTGAELKRSLLREVSVLYG
ncbi:MAG: hypothetical protein AB1793_06830 [Candidatus Thermoplasmatota archaeon]